MSGEIRLNMNDYALIIVGNHRDLQDFDINKCNLTPYNNLIDELGVFGSLLSKLLNDNPDMAPLLRRIGNDFNDAIKTHYPSILLGDIQFRDIVTGNLIIFPIFKGSNKLYSHTVAFSVN